MIDNKLVKAKIRLKQREQNRKWQDVNIGNMPPPSSSWQDEYKDKKEEDISI